jgi:plastocyanin
MRHGIAIIGIVIAGLAPAGCGDDDKSGSSDAPAVALEAGDFYFKPPELSLKAGTAGAIEVKNAGPSEHTFTVEGLKVDKEVEGGKSVRVEVSPAAGTYPFHCRYHPEQMVGKLNVS